VLSKQTFNNILVHIIHMAHMTLSLPDEVYEEIKEHPEIKWSEIARASIIAYLKRLRGSTSSKEILALLSPEAQESIKDTDEKKAKKLHKKMVDEEWKEHKSLTRA
jgi:hypothetical protein